MAGRLRQKHHYRGGNNVLRPTVIGEGSDHRHVGADCGAKRALVAFLDLVSGRGSKAVLSSI